MSDDYEKSRLDPVSVFDTPEAVLAHETFTTAQKIEVLWRWEYDAREVEVAEEESIRATDGAGDLLDRIHLALHALGAEIDLEDGPPTKQGGVARSDVKPGGRGT